MVPVCANCGACTVDIFADSEHSISEHGVFEDLDGETFVTVKGWLCLDCLPPEIREIFWPPKAERILH